MAIPVKEKNVKLKVKRDFYDKTNNLKLKKAGEELSVSPDRAEKLISLGLAEKPAKEGGRGADCQSRPRRKVDIAGSG